MLSPDFVVVLRGRMAAGAERAQGEIHRFHSAARLLAPPSGHAAAE
ncbi:hypothetical protein [Burkholderia sp. ABCPW 14]|nr:hypothetical protein [Burkholderia sp. ABCPW 14]